MISRLPRFTLPIVTSPSISETTAGLDGLRASNKLGDTRQTTGDITRLTNGTRNLHDYFAGFHLLAVFHYHVTTHREIVCTDQLTVLGHDMRSRHLRLVLGLDDDDFAQTGGFVGFHFIGDVLDDAFKLNLTRSFGDDDRVERVPTGNEFSFSTTSPSAA